MTDGRRKGNSYENEIARKMSIWYGGPSFKDMSTTNLLFRRREADDSNLISTWVGGRDLIHDPRIKVPWCIELKKVEANWDLGIAMTSSKWGPWMWWEQAKRQAVEAELTPLLIFSKNRSPDLALLSKAAFFNMHRIGPEPTPRIMFNDAVVLPLDVLTSSTPPSTL